MARSPGSLDFGPTKRELEGIVLRAYENAIGIGSDWQTHPGSVRLPWLALAHELGETLERIRPDEPLEPPIDMSPLPADMPIEPFHYLYRLTPSQFRRSRVA